MSRCTGGFGCTAGLSCVGVFGCTQVLVVRCSALLPPSALPWGVSGPRLVPFVRGAPAPPAPLPDVGRRVPVGGPVSGLLVSWCPFYSEPFTGVAVGFENHMQTTHTYNTYTAHTHTAYTKHTRKPHAQNIVCSCAALALCLCTRCIVLFSLQSALECINARIETNRHKKRGLMTFAQREALIQKRFGVWDRTDAQWAARKGARMLPSCRSWGFGRGHGFEAVHYIGLISRAYGSGSPHGYHELWQ